MDEKQFQKNIAILFLSIGLSNHPIVSLMCLAQVPVSFYVQGVILNHEGEVVTNQMVEFRKSMIQNNIPTFIETHDPTTNQFGLVNNYWQKLAELRLKLS